MANYIYVTGSGTVVPDTADIKETIQNEYKNALGDDISLEDSTPQGRLIDIETAARAAVIENNALVANLFNIKLSYGIFLDAILANFGMYRTSATPSRVKAILTGQKDTVIPASSQVATQTGVVFYSENELVIGNDGTVEGDFLSLETGPITCAAGELTKIIDGTYGWETISNPSPAILGTNRESDEHFKQRFSNSGLFTGKALIENYYKALLEVSNVKSAFVYDNGSNEDITCDTVLIPPHSIYCCVDGGNDLDIASAILGVKSSGCGYCGNTTVSVVEEISGAVYDVTFDRPQSVDIFVSIVVNKGTSPADNLENTIKNAILSYASGEISGYSGLNIGQDVSAFEMAIAVNNFVSGIAVKDLVLGTSLNEVSHNEILIHVNQKADISYQNIEVIINE